MIDIDYSFSTLEKRRAAERERTRARVSSLEILIAGKKKRGRTAETEYWSDTFSKADHSH